MVESPLGGDSHLLLPRAFLQCTNPTLLIFPKRSNVPLHGSQPLFHQRLCPQLHFLEVSATFDGKTVLWLLNIESCLSLVCTQTAGKCLQVMICPGCCMKISKNRCLQAKIIPSFDINRMMLQVFSLMLVHQKT